MLDVDAKVRAKGGPHATGCVTDKDVDAEDVDRALDAFREITSGW